MSHLWVISLSVFLTSVGQMLFKKGMMGLDLPLQQTSLWKLIGYGLVNGYVLLGFLSFGTGALLWLAVLAKEEVSYAYPLSSLGYIVVLLGSSLFFQEQISTYRIIGVLILVLGAFFIEYSR
jgi:drug/metabolite transporter (DMT)-like permease